MKIPDQSTQLHNPREIADFLLPFGITYEQRSPDAVLPDDPSNEQILAGYASQIEALKKRGGYVTADVINVTRDVPDLQAMPQCVQAPSGGRACRTRRLLPERASRATR